MNWSFFSWWNCHLKNSDFEAAEPLGDASKDPCCIIKNAHLYSFYWPWAFGRNFFKLTRPIVHQAAWYKFRSTQIFWIYYAINAPESSNSHHYEYKIKNVNDYLTKPFKSNTYIPFFKSMHTWGSQHNGPLISNTSDFLHQKFHMDTQVWCYSIC